MTAAEALDSIPSPIKIGVNRYAVEVVDIIDPNDNDCCAIIEPETQIIKLVRSHTTAMRVVGSLLHEVLHGIWDDRGLPNKPDEERVILQLESGLVQLFHDNPKLLTWIKRGIRK